MMFAAESTDYGSLNQLVHAVSTLVAVAIDIGTLWWLRPKLANVPDALVKAAEVVLTVIGIVLVWTQFSELSSGPQLIRWLEYLGAGFALGLIVLVVLSIGWTVLKYRDADDETSVIGGFWLTTNGRTEAEKGDGVQGAYESLGPFQADQVWTVSSRILAQGLFLIFDFVVAVCGSVALTAAAMLLLIYQVPRIHEFSITPPAVEANGTATIHWKVSDNASTVELDPFGGVARQGDRPEIIAKNTEFKLTASNTFGSRSVEQGVAVVPPAPKPPLPVVTTKTKSGKKVQPEPPEPADITVEARTCSLIQNVVIRGAGWLETENEKDPNMVSRASCPVSVPSGGRYEVFITYASAESWPLRVALNRQIIDDSALGAPTGGWEHPNQKEQRMGVWTLNAGRNEVELYREHPIPHIQRIRLRPSS